MAATRQGRMNTSNNARKKNLKPILGALALLSVCAAVYSTEQGRTSALARRSLDVEVRDLDERFQIERERLDLKLEDLKARATRDLPVAAGAPRQSLPENVLSASVWEIPMTLTQNPTVNRIAGADPNSAWEQALYRILPGEILKRIGQSPQHFVLPLRGSDTDANSETLRLGLFFQSVPGKPIRVSALAFRPVALLSGDSGAGLKRFLIDESGLILAHPRISETGVRTSSLADLFRKTEANSAGRSARLRLSSKSWEGFPTTMRFERIPGWNAFLVLEKVHSPVKAGLSATLLVNTGVFLGVLMGVLLLAVGFGFGPRRKEKEIEHVKDIQIPSTPPRMGLRELRANPPPFIPRTPITSLGNGNGLPVFSGGVDSELGRFLHARSSRAEGHEQSRLLREKVLLEEFSTGQGGVETRLVESCAKATQSPALFFRYEPLQGIARLTAEAGYPASQSIIGAGGMSFSFPPSLIAEVHADDANAKRRNLWDHAPLSRLMLSRLGIANFEAWPMIHRVNSAHGPSRFIGVLVIAESGVDSVLHREFLGSLLERASRVYG